MSDRLVSAKCAECGTLNGYMVAEDASGEAIGTCEACRASLTVKLDRSEVSDRDAMGDRERCAAAHACLEALSQAVREYLEYRDICVDDLPLGSPLRAAIEATERELAFAARR